MSKRYCGGKRTHYPEEPEFSFIEPIAHLSQRSFS
jgi:hypothetical protein